MIATKVDNARALEVSEAEGKTMAAQYCMPFFQTSAKTNVNVFEVRERSIGASLL